MGEELAGTQVKPRLLPYIQALYRGCNFLAYCCASLYITSGVAKLISPSDSFETVKLLFKNILSLDISYSYVILCVFGLVAWEAILGILYIFGFGRRLVLWAFMCTNVLFIFISHYLNRINRLESCGCMGKANKVFAAMHFPCLYTFSVAIILLLINEDPQRGELHPNEIHSH